MESLIGKSIYLRPYEASDAASLLEMHRTNFDFSQKYSPTFSEDYLTLEATNSLITHSASHAQEDQAYSFGIFEQGSSKLVGEVSLNRISRGPLQRAMIGYSLDQRFNGKGYMTEAVALLTRYAFEKLDFHRVEAGVMLTNIGSMRVLEKTGYKPEGIERKGVKINGNWEDHRMFSIIEGDEIKGL